MAQIGDCQVFNNYFIQLRLSVEIRKTMRPVFMRLGREWKLFLKKYKRLPILLRGLHHQWPRGENSRPKSRG
jgi:hypothetical protein